MAGRTDPFVSHSFQIELGGQLVAGFQEVSGISGSQELFEIKEGGLNHRAHKFAGRASYGDITLKKGFYVDPLLFTWLDNAGKLTQTERMDGAIIMFGGNAEVCRWQIYGAFPIKWDPPAVNATSSALAVESITIAVEYVEMVTPDYQPAPASEEDPPPPPPPPATPPIDMTLDGVNFASGSSAISPDPNPQLDSLAALLESNPDKNIRVEGHTDSQGSSSSNQTLSQARADSTRDYLINSGTDPARVTAVGYGEDQPIADNGTSAGRAQNRRVDVVEL